MARTFLFLICLFLLYSCKNPVAVVRIGMCSDVHLPTMHDSERRISSFIDSMNIAKPDFIVELGDFGTPDPKYAQYFAIWNSFPGPKHHIIGNHEMDGGTSREKAIEYRGMDRAYYTFQQNGFLFIVLDANDKKDPSQKGYSSYIGPEQVSWLNDELEKATLPIVIFSHQGIGSDPGNPGEHYSIDNAIEVRAILEKHNSVKTPAKIIACFNGHTHHDAAENIGGIWYITINSMAYKWLGEEYAQVRYSDEVDSLYRWIKFTAPYKDPLYTVVEISSKGYIKIAGKYSEWVGPSPWECGYPEHLKEFVKPQITERLLEF